MRVRAACIVAGCAGSLASLAQVHSVPLNGAWTLREGNGPLMVPAVVPGTVHTDLMAAGVVPDPFVGRNVDSVQWVEERDWSYERIFEVDDGMLSQQHIDLVLHGVDTFGEVYVNDAPIGTTDNMFRTWVFPMRDRVRKGANRLRITLRSPMAKGRALRDAYGIQLPADNEAGTIKVSPYMRKAAYQFGWDFAPRLVTSGIWQPVELRCWSGVRLAEVRLVQANAGTDAIVGVEVRLEGTPEPGDALVLDIDGQRTWVPITAASDPPAKVRASLSIKDVRPWWPNGSGEQVLYPLQLEVVRKGVALDRWQRSVGLRTISLDQHAGAFRFMVNGAPLFAKGANLVPPDMFLPRAGDSTWVRLVRDMQRAHFNMVRVWGGGVYPPDAFFEACDTAGIMVWQDLMFADLPPGDNAFLANVREEIHDQVARIDGHACLALWCGNNELEVAWKNWGWQASYGIGSADSARIWTDYTRLFAQDLPEWIHTWSSAPYTPTTPLSNWGNEAGLLSGDLHDWEVWHGNGTFERFQRNVGRFVSEYGFQSYPDSAYLARYIDPAHLFFGSPDLAYRQRSYKTDRPILEAIGRELHTAPFDLGRFIVLGQQVQALALRTAIRAHVQGQPHCMGTLFWQLNDAWPGPSWSAIDQGGHWKPAMHVVREEFGSGP